MVDTGLRAYRTSRALLPLQRRFDEFTMASESLSEAIVWFPPAAVATAVPPSLPPSHDPVHSHCVSAERGGRKWMFDWEQSPRSAFCTEGSEYAAPQSCSHATRTHDSFISGANDMPSSASDNWLISGKLAGRACVVWIHNNGTTAPGQVI